MHLIYGYSLSTKICTDTVIILCEIHFVKGDTRIKVINHDKNKDILTGFAVYISYCYRLSENACKLNSDI